MEATVTMKMSPSELDDLCDAITTSIAFYNLQAKQSDISPDERQKKKSASLRLTTLLGKLKGGPK